MSKTSLERFERSYAVDEATGCWVWTLSLDRDGYGNFWDGTRLASGNPRNVKAHRWAYETFVGLIPEGLQIDHVCHSQDETCPGGRSCPHRSCVNPDHLEPVTPGENVRRGHTGEITAAWHRAKTSCPRGHPYDDQNTYINPGTGSRHCRTCTRLRRRQRSSA